MATSPFRGYLTVYNLVFLFGWGYVLFNLLSNIHDFDISGTDTEFVVLWLEIVSFAEVIHAMTGLVPGNPLAGLMLHLGRLISMAVPLFSREVSALGIADLHYPRVAPNHWAIWALFFLWAIAEVVRETFYLVALWVPTDKVPYALTWLRYTLTLALLPFGYAAEIKLILLVYPTMNLYQQGVAQIYLLLAYLVGGNYLIRVMFVARQKKVNPKTDEPKKKD